VFNSFFIEKKEAIVNMGETPLICYQESFIIYDVHYGSANLL
jgi:hypothetical protein